jgi:hypothetical protein
MWETFWEERGINYREMIIVVCFALPKLRRLFFTSSSLAHLASNVGITSKSTGGCSFTQWWRRQGLILTANSSWKFSSWAAGRFGNKETILSSIGATLPSLLGSWVFLRKPIFRPIGFRKTKEFSS